MTDDNFINTLRYLAASMHFIHEAAMNTTAEDRGVLLFERLAGIEAEIATDIVALCLEKASPAGPPREHRLGDSIAKEMDFNDLAETIHKKAEELGGDLLANSRGRIAELKDGLRPFADVYAAQCEGDPRTITVDRPTPVRVDLGDCRAAWFAYWDEKAAVVESAPRDIETGSNEVRSP